MVGAERAGRRQGRRRLVHRAIASTEADRKGAKPHPAGSRRGHDRGPMDAAGKKRAHRYVSHQTRVDSVDYALAKLIRDFNLWGEHGAKLSSQKRSTRRPSRSRTSRWPGGSSRIPRKMVRGAGT